MSGNGHGGEVIASRELGVPEDERGTQGKGDQQNQDHCGQAVIGNRFSLSGGTGVPGAVMARVQKAVFESPVLGKIHPAIVLVFPTAVAQLTNQVRRKDGWRKGGNPEPFMIRDVRGSLS